MKRQAIAKIDGAGENEKIKFNIFGLQQAEYRHATN